MQIQGWYRGLSGVPSARQTLQMSTKEGKDAEHYKIVSKRNDNATIQIEKKPLYLQQKGNIRSTLCNGPKTMTLFHYGEL